MNEPAQTDPFVGTVIDGRYSIDAVVGKGGMGIVYSGRHVALGKRVALKVLRQEVSDDDELISRFKLEAQAASSIGSAHICDVSDFGTLPSGATYFVMEFLDGPSLTKVIKNESPFSAERICQIGAQICDALGAAHDSGIVHRDLKPDNIHLIDRGGGDFVKVLDFGIAKVGDAVEKRLTAAGQVFGTPHYMSPEQCSGLEVDHRADIYALGVMLYEMVVGKVPFDADSLMGVLTKQVYEAPLPPRAEPTAVGCSPGLEAIILRCLVKQPEARYQSMGEVRQDLERELHGMIPAALSASQELRVAPTIEPPDNAAPEESSPAVAALWVFLGLIALGLLGGAAFAVAYHLGGGGDPSTGRQPIATPVDSDTASTDTAGTDTTQPVNAEGPDASVESQTTAGDGEAQDGETTETPSGEDVSDPTGSETAQEDRPSTAETIRVTTIPTGAEVYGPEGSLLGNTPLDLPRPEGRDVVQLRLRRSGFRSRSVVLSQRTDETLNVRLRRRGSRRGTGDQGGGGRTTLGSDIVDPFDE